MTDLRNINVAGQAAVIPKDQPAPMLEWVSIDKLLIDDSYQRSLAARNWSSIRRIAEDFHWSRFTPVLVAPVEDGLFAIIDGQHRTHAAAICGFKTVPAMVVHMPRTEQAQAFSWVNSQVVRITPHHVYKAALAAAETWALDCRAAVEAADCRLMTSNASSGAKRPGEIFSIGFIKETVLRGHAAAITTALRGIRDFDKGGRVTLYTDYIVRPLIQVLAEDGALRQADIAAAFGRHDPFRLLDHAERHREPSVAIGAAHRSALRVLLAQSMRAGAA